MLFPEGCAAKKQWARKGFPPRKRRRSGTLRHRVSAGEEVGYLINSVGISGNHLGGGGMVPLGVRKKF